MELANTDARVGENIGYVTFGKHFFPLLLNNVSQKGLSFKIQTFEEIKKKAHPLTNLKIKR